MFCLFELLEISILSCKHYLGAVVFIIIIIFLKYFSKSMRNYIENCIAFF